MLVFRITEKNGNVTYFRGPIEGIDLFNNGNDKSFHFVDDEGNFHMWPLDIIKEINFIGLKLGRKKVKDEVH